MFTEAKDDGGGGDNWSYKSFKAPVKSSSPTNQHPVSLTGRIPFLSPNQHCQSTEGKNIIFHGLAYPKLTWGLPTLSVTTNSSWLPRGRVVMPLISHLMPVPQWLIKITVEYCSKYHFLHFPRFLPDVAYQILLEMVDL